MEGERILKSLLNGETDGLFEDTKVCASSGSKFWAFKLIHFYHDMKCELNFSSLGCIGFFC